MTVAAAQRGTTTVSDKAVRKIAERVAAEAVSVSVPGAGAAKGSATVRGRRADVAVDVALRYPTPLPGAVRALQKHVTDRTHRLTGLDIAAVRIAVTALIPVPAAAKSVAPRNHSAPASAEPVVVSRTPLRWWSRRRLPMGLLTLAAAVACGALAFDLILVHTAHRPAALWRTHTLNWLSGHGPGEPSVVIGAGVLAVLGLLMITLALAPGRRGLLTLASPSPRLRAAVDRGAVAVLVRDAVGDTQGIGRVRVRVRRRTVAVRARLAFGDRAVARHQVESAAGRALEGCGLRRVPRLRVRVRPEAAWDPETEEGGGGVGHPVAVTADGRALEGANR
ncbi:DUF6286 domain-containing Asp23/Gls24 family envelope stress response protein [Streptomyces sp. NPDC057199]|uniref:DUF6286 domain-containing Asp23/Gls24 family envelope stress response protein n=1 Tax=Streptomyces sp. NPDC057199 TaxID=3346047 RepID=UPI0036406A33